MCDQHLVLIMHRQAKPLEKEKPGAIGCMDTRKTMGKEQKAKGQTNAPKLVVYIGGTLGQQANLEKNE